MTDNSTSGIIGSTFIGGDELQPSYESVESRGFNQLMKVKRQGRWFMLKGLKPEFRRQQFYLELLKKEYELMVQLDHPNVTKTYCKEENLWHTPKRDDLLYILFVRNTASGVRFAKACVNDVNGLLLLPDNWKTVTYQLNSVNNAERDFNTNVIGLTDWQQVMEPAGAVFLPQCGARTVGGVFMDLGGYHTADAGAVNSYGMGIWMDKVIVSSENGHRGDGGAVRLVREVK